MGHIELDGRWPYHSPPVGRTGEVLQCWIELKNTDWVPPWECRDVKVHHYLYRKPDFKDLFNDGERSDCLHPLETAKITTTFTMPRTNLYWYAEWFTLENDIWLKRGSNMPVLIDNPDYEEEEEEVPWWRRKIIGVQVWQYGAIAGGAGVLGLATR